MLEFLERLFTTPPQDTKLLKTIIIKVIPEVLEFLMDGFKESMESRTY